MSVGVIMCRILILFLSGTVLHNWPVMLGVVTMGNSNLTINGSAITVNGNTDNQDNSTLTVNYQAPTDSNLGSNSYTLSGWRDILN